MERPNRQKHLSVAQRGAIIGQHMGGLSNAAIARSLNVSDNCSFHRSRYTRQWFSAHPELELIRAPVNSPDLNPIENTWAMVVKGWETIYPRNKTRLEEKLYASMPHRMQAVIDANGGPTKY
ncbi:Transposable element Tcb2 transposase [Pseudolycoriella hygida]|uniref:Transposable element Tcb2 transposase n=1 Tax=Pseudolycoriella hygida TaxID=35572 RepID=A0A9Q0S3G8_9DIPT|nr:Transposable element Tcb2 transposase [Pseudolycoriella hygida]